MSIAVNFWYDGEMVNVDHPAIVAETRMRDDIMTRIRYFTNVNKVDVYVVNRVPSDAPEYKHPGWLEWLMRVEFNSHSGLTLGAIQRTPDSTTEFHS